MNLTLKVWRQKGAQEKGRIVEYKCLPFLLICHS